MALLAGSSLLAAGPLRANTELDVASGQTPQGGLNTAPNYTQTTTPATTSDVTFTAAGTYANTSPNTAVFPTTTPPSGYYIDNPSSATILNIGTLNDLSGTPIVIYNNNAGTAGPITLNGGTDSVAGSATGDLLYVASGAI